MSLGSKKRISVQKGNWVKSRNYQIISVLETSHLSFPPNTCIGATRDVHFDVNSHLYSLEHTYKSSNPLCLWSADCISIPSGGTKNLDGCQRAIRTTLQLRLLNTTRRHHTESTRSHCFPPESQHYFIISEPYITAWWKWEYRSGPQNIQAILVAKET